MACSTSATLLMGRCSNLAACASLLVRAASAAEEKTPGDVQHARPLAEHVSPVDFHPGAPHAVPSGRPCWSHQLSSSVKLSEICRPRPGVHRSGRCRSRVSASVQSVATVAAMTATNAPRWAPQRGRQRQRSRPMLLLITRPYLGRKRPGRRPALWHGGARLPAHRAAVAGTRPTRSALYATASRSVPPLSRGLVRCAFTGLCRHRGPHRWRGLCWRGWSDAAAGRLCPACSGAAASRRSCTSSNALHVSGMASRRSVAPGTAYRQTGCDRLAQEGHRLVAVQQQTRGDCGRQRTKGGRLDHGGAELDCVRQPPSTPTRWRPRWQAHRRLIHRQLRAVLRRRGGRHGG